MGTVPIEQIRLFTPHVAGDRSEVTHYKEPLGREGEEMHSTSPIKQNSEAGSGHNRCGK